MRTTITIATTKSINVPVPRLALNCSFTCLLFRARSANVSLSRVGTATAIFSNLQVVEVPQAIVNRLVTEQGLNFANVAGAFGRFCRDLVPQLLDRY